MLGDIACMADASIYVPVISASAAILGAAISPVSNYFQYSRQAKRDREEQYDTALRAACVDLLRAVGELRDQVASNHEYRGGDEMGARLAQMRQYVTAAKLHAVSIALLAPRALAEPAEQLAKAADRLGAAAAESTDPRARASNRAPDFRELETSIVSFSEAAVAHARRKPVANRARGRRAVSPPHDAAPTAADR